MGFLDESDVDPSELARPLRATVHAGSGLRREQHEAVYETAFISV
jgi:hypothetical protein